LVSDMKILLLSIILVMLFVIGFLYLDIILQPEPEAPWQAVIKFNNWTNTTLDVDLYVFGGTTLQYSFTFDHGENITLTLTWRDIKETLVFAHSVGEGIDNWSVYELTPGEWRAVILW
jgi:hypothetical protein